MIVNDYTRRRVERGSSIRQIFELGAEFSRGGKRPVDLSLGNPEQPPPEAYYEALERILSEARACDTNMHGYMPNGGLPGTRSVIAAGLQQRYAVEFLAEGIFMTAGAVNALDVVLKTLIEPVVHHEARTVRLRDEESTGKAPATGKAEPLPDEVIVVAPYFPEYPNLIARNQGVPVVAQATAAHRLDFDALELAISAQTKALIINSPNNPTGVVYGEHELEQLSALLRRKNEELGIEIVVIEDAPYGRLLYEGRTLPTMMAAYPHSIFVESFSKSLGLAGERIGYIALHPEIVSRRESWEILCAAVTMNIRSTVVNAPALQQRVIEAIGFSAAVSADPYRRRSERLRDTLSSLGFRVAEAEGGFFLFAELPKLFDSEALFRRYAHSGDEPLLYVPGVLFGGDRYSRHIRIGVCVSDAEVERACRRLREIAAHAAGSEHIESEIDTPKAR